VTPTWHGDSVGHYEGDTLVVDTIGMKVGRLGRRPAGSPYSEALHVVERYRLITYEGSQGGTGAQCALERSSRNATAASIDPNYQGKGPAGPMHVEDPNVFNRPWSGMATYSRADEIWVENVCAENISNTTQRETGVPKADKPDFRPQRLQQPAIALDRLTDVQATLNLPSAGATGCTTGTPRSCSSLATISSTFKPDPST